MTEALLIAGTGALVGLGFFAAITAFVPQMPDLRTAVATLTTTELDPVRHSSDRRDRIGAWLSSRAPRLPGTAVSDADLDLLGLTPAQHYYRKGVGALIGFAAPLALPVLFAALGMPRELTAFMGLVPLLAAVMGWFAPDSTVRSRAKRARVDFARAAAVFLEFVAGALRSGQHAPVALRSAAAGGQSWPFRRIALRLQRARATGQHPWDALAELGDELRVPELRDAGTIVALAGQAGGSVYEALMNRGIAARTENLTDYQAEENARTQGLSVPQLISSFLVVAIVFIPFLAVLLQPQQVLP